MLNNTSLAPRDEVVFFLTPIYYSLFGCLMLPTILWLLVHKVRQNNYIKMEIA